MNKKKMLLISFVVVCLLLAGYWIGYFKARYNIVVMTESKYDDMVKAYDKSQEQAYNAELEENLLKMQ